MRLLKWGWYLLVFISLPVAGQGVEAINVHSGLKESLVEREVSTVLRLLSEYERITEKAALLKSREGKAKRKYFEVGDTTHFFVRDITRLENWLRVNASCVRKENNFAIWVTERDLNVFSDSLDIPELLDSLSYYLSDATLSGSVNPDRGIIDNNTSYFGDLPDVDNDGILDILLLDIEDGFESTGSYVAGFFDPVDLTDHEFSNQRDLIYVDLYPTFYYKSKINLEGGVSTLAHEMQHLIHAGYETTPRQYTFINEGLSEFAEVLNGFSPRSPQAYFSNTHRSLLSWDYTDPIPDYARASLFFTYLFEQIGVEKARYLVTERTGNGYNSLEKFIDSHSAFTLKDIFRNWGITLLGAIGGEWGYQNAQLKNVFPTSASVIHTLPSGVVGERNSLSHSFMYMPLTSHLFYRSNDEVELSAIPLYPEQGSELPQVLNAQFSATEGKHGSLMVVSSNVSEQIGENDTLKYTERIIFEGERSGEIKNLVYDDGINDPFLGNASYLQLSNQDTELAVVFSNEIPFWLQQVEIKAVFRSELQGSGVSSETERDVQLQIFSIKNGIPTEPISSSIIHSFNRPFGNLRFESISLNQLYSQLSDITDSIAVVIKNDPDDENYIALAMDYSGSTHSLAKVQGDEWKSLDRVEVSGMGLEGWNPMVRANIIIDALQQIEIEPQVQLTSKGVIVSFDIGNSRIDTASSVSVAMMPSGNVMRGTLNYDDWEQGSISFSFIPEVGGTYQILSSVKALEMESTYKSEYFWEIPEKEGFKVGRNYPNPFNPSTSIPFVLLEAGEIEVRIFNVLGRLVKTLPVKQYESGQHDLRLTLEGVASGMYFVQLNVSRSEGRGAATQIRKVMFLK